MAEKSNELFVNIFVAKLSTVFCASSVNAGLSDFTSLCLLILSDEDRVPSAGSGAGEDLRHARPQHARERHQGPDHAL